MRANSILWEGELLIRRMNLVAGGSQAAMYFGLRSERNVIVLASNYNTNALKLERLNVLFKNELWFRVFLEGHNGKQCEG